MADKKVVVNEKFIQNIKNKLRNAKMNNTSFVEEEMMKRREKFKAALVKLVEKSREAK